MYINHLAIYTQNLEATRTFYEKYFNAIAGEKYHNSKKNFTSYFLSFENGCRLELMHKPTVPSIENEAPEHLGLTHFAVSVGSKKKVDELTEILRKDGFSVVGEARTTGDGYYESIVLDPENNRIEITV